MWKDYFKVNTDHKVIGVQYLVTTFIFFIIGGMLAEGVRAELATPGLQYFSPATYNALFSVHAALMIFLFVIPAFAGLGNFVIPIMIGAQDMAFPRLNALSYWMLPVAGMCMVSSFLVGPFDAGWTNYATLSVHGPPGQTFWVMGVQFAGVLVDRDRGQLPGHDRDDAGAGDGLLAHAAAGLGQPGHLDAGRAGHAVHRRLAVHGALRPDHGHALLRSDARRQRDRLPAHLLVLLATRRCTS